MPRNDIIYLLRATTTGKWGLPKTVHKIGISDRSASARVREIRDTGGPQCAIVAETKRGDARDKETELHRKYRHKKWTFRRKFSGHTEFFALDRDEVNSVKAWMGAGGLFDLDRVDEVFMWALLAAGIYAAF